MGAANIGRGVRQTCIGGGLNRPLNRRRGGVGFTRSSFTGTFSLSAYTARHTPGASVVRGFYGRQVRLSVVRQGFATPRNDPLYAALSERGTTSTPRTTAGLLSSRCRRCCAACRSSIASNNFSSLRANSSTQASSRVISADALSSRMGAVFRRRKRNASITGSPCSSPPTAAFGCQSCGRGFRSASAP